jgi:hypothetical protein
VSVASWRANLAYSAWVGSMVRGARLKVRGGDLGAPQRAMWAGLSRGILDASQLPSWMRLWQPVRPIDADLEDDFYRSGRLWGELIATCFRERARAGRPLRGAEAQALLEACSRYTAELAFPRRGGGALIDAVGGPSAADSVHEAGMEAVRRRGREPDAETQRTMRRWLDERMDASRTR